jgi:phage terminase large subunit
LSGQAQSPLIAINDAYLTCLDDYAPLQILFGGSASGKSVFKAQQAVIDVLEGGRNYLICRQVGRTIRRSVFAEVRKVITSAGLTPLFDINKSELIITCNVNGYQILFAGLDDVEKIKSITPDKGVITDIWIEEATETERDTLKQLQKRMRGGDERTRKRITLTFNPIFKTHWIYQDYFASVAWADDQAVHNSPELSILKTTYKDNHYLTRQDIDGLENETDEYYRDVYTLGKWGILGDVIFKNWTTQDLSGMRDQFTNHRHGLDFGFSSDPAALAVTHYDRARKIVYIYDEMYERGLTNDILAQEINRRVHDQPVTCDSAEPKSIAELSGYGINAQAAVKGKDSVNFGIQWLQQQAVVIDSNCIAARNEFSIYHWRKDRDGNAIRQPVAKNDHLIDAIRYAYECEMQSGEAVGEANYASESTWRFSNSEY